MLETTAGARPTRGSLNSWQFCTRRAGSVVHPSQLSAPDEEWLPATVPGTVASNLSTCEQWSFDQPLEIDAHDWWFRTTFDCHQLAGQHPVHLHFDGLATLAEVWLNGEPLLVSDNMFRSYCVDVSSHLRSQNELTIAFRSISEDLKRKRPRPRWKTSLVNNQQLRWHRTSLQGRIPGWSPPAPAIGPWRAVRLEAGPITPHGLHIRSQLDGTTGIVSVSGQILSAAAIRAIALRVGSQVDTLQFDRDVNGYSIRGDLHIAQVRTWWPHTHGQPALYDCELLIDTVAGSQSVPLSPVGFRELEVTTGRGFEVRVNGESIYCRGACWTVSDILTLSGSEEQLRHDLTLARDAGINMLRVGGTMVYESETFYRLCDELGVMVWQDFMFANMDYPADDEPFRQNIVAEATEQLSRLASHPCVAVYCGSSEIEQQAAMLGMPREIWTNSWFAEQLPALCGQLHPGTHYVPSTPTGGTLPFHPATGITHYYGVGAYLRPTTDVRRSDVKFTPECLGFSNIPDAATIDAVVGSSALVTHDPRWKRRVPRDTGAGWDFEDVRDHYLRELFQVDPVQLRSREMPRYLQLGRLVSGEMMHQAFAEWRSCHGNNHGALVWFYKDLWPGAGWGIIDSTGTPKAAYYYLKRSWASRQLVVTDEGLNGLQIHLVNETIDACNGTVEVTLLKEPSVVIARQELAARVDGRSRRVLSADEVLGGFYDVSYAYRFGAPHHDVAVVTWLDASREVISEAFHFIQRGNPAMERSVELKTSGEELGDGRYRITLESDRFLHGVQVAAKGYLPDDNYFHMPPGRVRSVTFSSRSPQPPVFKASVEALNMEAGPMIVVKAQSATVAQNTQRPRCLVTN
jgi:beta-mannosidase